MAEMIIVFGNTVNVNAGPDVELCADNGAIQLNGIVSGSYQVVVTNANGCARTYNYSVGYNRVKARFRN